MTQDLFLAVDDAQAETLQGGDGAGFSFMKTINVTPTSFMSMTTLTSSKGVFSKVINISFAPTSC